jgi:lycopene cyclase domain-containing protein
MSYALLVIPFAALTLAVTLASAVRPRFARRMAASALGAAVLVVLTVVFDNLMIAADLFTYPEQHLSGLKIGLAPVEDLSYAVCAAFLVPAVFALLTRRPAPAAT